MLPKLQYHVEPEKGWLNDPNGLCYFNGKYHAFFQHYPNATVWTAPLYWAHVTSDDLIHWEEQPMGLTPDQPYESTGGCFSGSAFIKDGKAYFQHPMTGTDLIGAPVPFCHEARQLVTDAALRVPELGYIGWDVAITEKGPILVEANQFPGHDIYQFQVHLGPDRIGLAPRFEEAMGGL